MNYIPLAHNVKDRLLLWRLYPVGASLDDQMTIRDIIRKVEISKEEREQISLKQTPSEINWDHEKATVQNIDFTEKEIKLLQAQVNRVDKEKSVTRDMVELCLKIKNAQGE